MIVETCWYNLQETNKYTNLNKEQVIMYLLEEMHQLLCIRNNFTNVTDKNWDQI